MGTMGYMSPEQLRGLPVDHRSDIFSFGAILYELLSGRKAFKKDSASDTIAAVLKEDPPELTQSGRNVSPALDHIVRHCLEKDRDNRFGTAKDVAFALSEASESATTVTSGAQATMPAQRGKGRLWVAAAVIAVLAVAGLLWSKRVKTGASATGGVKRVAVLPFENLGAPEDDYFADGISDQIRGKLTTVPGIVVIARGSSTPYKKTKKTPQEIAGELSANYLLTATVRWEKGGGQNRVQVNPELVEIVRDGPPESRWQQSFDATLTDVFQVQSDVATKAAQALGVALGTGAEKRLSEKPTADLAAYDAFLKGEAASNGLSANDPATLRRALAFYDQAVALDPSFAQAWARIAVECSLLYANAIPTTELADRARQAAEKAIALAPGRPDPYLGLSYYQRLVVRDARAAREACANGLRLAPTDAALISAGAAAEQMSGNWEAALEHTREAVRLDPRSASVVRRLGIVLASLRRYPEAHEVFDRALALTPSSAFANELKLMTFLGQGDLAAARSYFQLALRRVEPAVLVAFTAQNQDLVWVFDEKQTDVLLRLSPDAFDGDRGLWGICIAQAYAFRGDAANMRTYAEEARKAFEEQIRQNPNDAQRHVGLGLALAYLGRKDEAIREGRQGVGLSPISKDAVNGPYVQHQLARIYINVGEPEKALDQIEPLLKIPYYLSPGWLKIDPNFDPLRKNPRFQKLVAGAP
jgi:TolB-like protein/tetratricopeptide (TPR) repeat protein